MMSATGTETRRFLLVTHHPPWPPLYGASQRTNLIYRALAALGDVDMLLFEKGGSYADEQLERLKNDFNLVAVASSRVELHLTDVEVLVPAKRRLLDRLQKQFNRWHLRYLPDRNVARWLGEQVASGRYQLIVCRYLEHAAKSGALLHPPVVVDIDDLDTQTYLSKAAIPGTSKRMARRVVQRGKALERVLPRLLKHASHLWVTNDEDLRLLGPERATVLPNIPFSPPPAPLPPKSDSSAILFVGSMEAKVNERAIERFIAEPWPKIRQQWPHSTLRVAGFGMTPEQIARWSSVPGVQPLGCVDDLELAYADCAFTVVPIFEGGGTKIKILESLSSGRCCVVTRLAHRSCKEHLREGESLLVADDENELVAACVRLLRDRKLRDSMAICGAQEVARHFSFDAFARIVRETAEKTCPHVPAPECREDSPQA